MEYNRGHRSGRCELLARLGHESKLQTCLLCRFIIFIDHFSYPICLTGDITIGSSILCAESNNRCSITIKRSSSSDYNSSIGTKSNQSWNNLIYIMGQRLEGSEESASMMPSDFRLGSMADKELLKDSWRINRRCHHFVPRQVCAYLQ